MNTDKEIKALAKTITPHYAYGTPRYLNSVTDKMRAKGQMPACLHMQTTDGGVTFAAGPYYRLARNSRRVQVGFADSIRIDADPEKTLDKVEELLTLGKDLVNRMNASGLWEPIDSVNYQVLYDTQDGNLVWVLLDMTVVEEEGDCIV